MLRNSEYYNADYFNGPKKGAYRFGYNDSGWYEHIAVELKAFFKFDRALDLGCAKGFIVRRLKALGVDVVGIDISEYAVCNAIVPDVLCRDILDGITDLGKFDLVLARDFMEHFTEDEVVLILKQVKSVLTNDGVFVASLMIDRDEFDKDESHIGIRPYEDWLRLFSLCGFVEYSPEHKLTDFVRGSHNLTCYFKVAK